MENGEILEAVLNWFRLGERGICPDAMAFAVTGQRPPIEWAAIGNHPCTADDFIRCVKFLDAVPMARERLFLVASLNEVWARLVEHWDDLEALSREEANHRWTGRLQHRLKELGC